MFGEEKRSIINVNLKKIRQADSATRNRSQNGASFVKIVNDCKL